MIQFPRYIQIETTVLCNAGCYFCPQDKLLRKPHYMEDTVWKKIIDDSRGRGVIYRPFLVNEPLTDQRLPEIMHYIKKDQTAQVELNSNGFLLSEKWSQNLLNSGLDIIRFSVDGFSAESYRASGRGDNYEIVLENILRFLEIKKDRNHPVKVHIRMIDLPANKSEQQAFLDFWGVRMDCAQIVPLYSWPWTGQISPYLKPCPKIREEMFFFVDGRATLCCWDNWERGVTGDIHYASVEEIWLGTLNQSYRRLLNEGKRDQILLCSRCDGFQKFDFSQWQGYYD